jgi:transposase-like protein
MAWTPELKEQIIAAYQGAEPTPETSTEIIKSIAEEHNQSPNGVRMVLVQAGVYVKKEAAEAGAKKESKAASGDGTKRVSKESSIAALKAAIEAKGKTVDDEILDKLTGKAAVYLTQVLS